jgi:ABC-type sulfate transport system permease subunit
MKIDVNTHSIFQLLLKNYFRVNLKIEQKRYFNSFLYTVAGNFNYSCRRMIYVFPLFSVCITIFCFKVKFKKKNRKNTSDALILVVSVVVIVVIVEKILCVASASVHCRFRENAAR